MFNQMDRYSDEQKQIHDYIKSLHDEGYGYRKISKILNDKGIKTHKGNKFLNTNVYSVLKFSSHWKSIRILAGRPLFNFY